MIAHCAPSIHRTNKLLPFGTVKEMSIHKKFCTERKRNFLLKFGKIKTQGFLLKSPCLVFTITILFFNGSRYSENAFVEIKEVVFIAVR